MDSQAFSAAAEWVLNRGYSLMFVAMFFEGPIVTAAAGFASALGYFNVFIVYLLSVAGDSSSDIIQYWLGRFGRGQLIEKYGHYFGLTKELLDKAENTLKDHSVKGLVTLKLLPVVPSIGLVTAGAIRMPFRKFLKIIFAVILPKSLLFALIGYYFGAAYEAVSKYLNIGLPLLGVAIILFFVVSHYVKKFSGKIAKKIESGISH